MSLCLSNSLLTSIYMYSSNYFSQSYHKTIINFEQTKKNDNNEEAKKYAHILYIESCKMKKDMTMT